MNPLSCTRLVRQEPAGRQSRSEEHTSELQSQSNLVCRLLLEKITTRGGTDQDEYGVPAPNLYLEFPTINFPCRKHRGKSAQIAPPPHICLQSTAPHFPHSSST